MLNLDKKSTQSILLKFKDIFGKKKLSTNSSSINNSPKSNLNIDIKKSINKISEFIQKNKKNSYYMIPVALIFLGFAILTGYNTYSKLSNMNKTSFELINVDAYNLSSFKANRNTQKDAKNIKTIPHVFDYKISVEKELDRYKDYLQSLTIPYKNFLQYIYLPRLNIWEDKFTKNIDTNLIGINFLKNNPYSDITLLEQWSNFFKYVGNNEETNDIKNISIGEVIEEGEEFFRIPINLSFTSSSKRAFLLLVDKLSVTSNQLNISLINEFTYHLWQEIMISKEKEIETIYTEYFDKNASLKDGFRDSLGYIDVDKFIGYHFYERIFNNKDNLLINDEIIINAIKKTISCGQESQDSCFYKFREKYRDIPNLAYILNKELSYPIVENLKNFYKSLPPVITLDNFAFDKTRAPQFMNIQNSQYEGNITINVYGRGISTDEVQRIGLELGKKCFNSEVVLSPSVGSNTTDKAITKTSEVSWTATSESGILWDIKTIIDNIKNQYDTLSNYNKIIKLFEIYRILEDNNLCES